MNRITKLYVSVCISSCLLLAGACDQPANTNHPNVILIITDDQGFGDLGFNGNPHVITPNLDKFASQSVRLNNFYVSPVCAPTRSSLLTGRYSLRTGVRDTYNGGAIMATEEITIAEMLKDVGYKTGMFGKWHLGDNYPSRPIDQGFDLSVNHLSGGMGQVGDFTTWFRRDSSYFDPILWKNGKQESFKGYCSDIFAEEALEFIESNKDNPFFCYLSFNAPHTPLQVPDKYYQLYKDIDPSTGFADTLFFPSMSEKDKEDARKVYAMVTNIDDNVGLLLQKLKELEIDDNTVVIFMTDNGPQQLRYVAEMRGKKGDVYRGGIRVPCYIKLPGNSHLNKDIETTAAHFDILPTIATLCDATVPGDRPIDGVSLAALIYGNVDDLKERSLFFNWTRRLPEKYNNVALQMGAYKLVGNTNFNATAGDFELFNLENDPYERNNISQSNPELTEELKNELDRIFLELIEEEHMVNPPRILVGEDAENPIILNRNDASGERGIWSQEEIFGYWRVHIKEGHYNIRFSFIEPVQTGGTVLLEAGTHLLRLKNDGESGSTVEMKNVYFPEIEGNFLPQYMLRSKKIFPFTVELERIL